MERVGANARTGRASGLAFGIGLASLIGLVATPGAAQTIETLPSTYDVEALDEHALERAARTRGDSIALLVGGRMRDVELEPVDLRSYRFTATESDSRGPRPVFPAPPKTYRGRVSGDAESVVRLSVTPGGVRGFIRCEEGWTFVRPAPTNGAFTRGEHLFFSDADLDPSEIGACAAVGPATAQAIAEEAELAEATGLRVVELAIDADVEYSSKYGSTTVSEIEAIMNEVDGIFQDDLGLTIELVHINTWTAEEDPYTHTNANDLLSQLASYWNSNFSSVDRDLVHLFTNKDLDNSTVGIAFVGVVCSTGSGYGLSQDLSARSLMPILVAHELGHNFNASHDPSGSDPRYVMYQSVSSLNLDQYSDASKTAIANFVASRSCLELLDDGGGDPDPPGGGGGETGGGGSSGGGGGGGGPVDPLVLAAIAAAYGLRRRQRDHRSAS